MDRRVTPRKKAATTTTEVGGGRSEHGSIGRASSMTQKGSSDPHPS